MKHSEKDKLEQFFQNSLESYKENPSPDLWSEMESSIPPPPSSTIPFWKTYGAGSFLILVIGLVVFIGFQKMQHAETLADINKTIELQDQTINKITKELDEVQNQFLEKEETKKDEENLKSNKNTISQQYIYKSEKNKKTQFSKNESKEEIAKKESAKTDENIISNEAANILQSKTKQDFSKKEDSPNTITSLGLNKIDEVAKIPTAFLLADFTENEKFDLSKEKYVVFKEKRIRRKGVEIFGNFNKIYPTIKLKESFLDYNNPNNQEYNYGLLLSFPVGKKGAIQYGLGFGKSHRSFAVENDFVYSNSEIEIGNNRARTNYIFNFTTNYNGYVKFQTFIDNNKENDLLDIQTGDSFTAKINYIKRQKYMVFPVFYKYYFSNESKKLNWSLKMGAIQRFAYSETEVAYGNASSFSQSRLKYAYSKIISINNDKSSRNQTELVLGTGIEYRFSKNGLLIFEPIFKQSMILEGNIRPYSFGFYTGVRWNFE